MNSNYVDSMMGRVMGVTNEDDLVKPGAMGDFYRDIDVCSGCYKVYRQLDKRRHKMREAARKHKSIKGGGMNMDGLGMDGVIGAGEEGGGGERQRGATATRWLQYLTHSLRSSQARLRSSMEGD